MLSSMASEALKIRKRPAIWILSGILLSTLAILTYLLLYALTKVPQPQGAEGQGFDPQQFVVALLPDNLIPTVLSAFNAIGAAIVVILGVLSTGSEYSWGTWKTVLAQRPGRLRVLAGKFATLALLLLGLTLVLFLLGAVCSTLIAVLEGAEIRWPSLTDLAPAIAAGWLILGLWCAFGAFLGILTRGTSLAIGIGLIYVLLLEGLLGGVLGQLEIVRTIRQFLPGANAGALVTSFGTAIEQQVAQEPIAGPARATLVVALYLVACLLLSAVLFRRRDLA